MSPDAIPAPPQVMDLKCWPEPFQAIVDRAKRCEVRREDDRAFFVGQLLGLREFVPSNTGGSYTGRIALAAVTHLQRGFGLPAGLVVLSIELRAIPQGGTHG